VAQLPEFEFSELSVLIEPDLLFRDRKTVHISHVLGLSITIWHNVSSISQHGLSFVK